MTKDIENHMVLPYADDEPLPPRPEEDPDEARDFHRSDNMKIDTLAAKLLEKELLRRFRSKK